LSFGFFTLFIGEIPENGTVLPKTAAVILIMIVFYDMQLILLYYLHLLFNILSGFS